MRAPPLKEIDSGSTFVIQDAKEWLEHKSVMPKKGIEKIKTKFKAE